MFTFNTENVQGAFVSLQKKDHTVVHLQAALHLKYMY